MKKVITYGTFDVLHYGHINLLKHAKKLGDYLIVVLSSDEFNKIKQKKSYYTYDQRKMILEACRYVDLVVPEYSWEQKIEDIQKYQADIFVMGDDWKGKFDFLKDYCQVVYLPRTPDVCSTSTKAYLDQKIQEIDKNSKRKIMVLKKIKDGNKRHIYVGKLKILSYEKEDKTKSPEEIFNTVRNMLSFSPPPFHQYSSSY